MPTLLKLLRYHSAGNAIARVSRRISLHVILFGMNDHRRSTVTEKRMVVTAQVNVPVDDAQLGFAIGLSSKVGHVASVMAVIALEAMMFAVRIEMGASRLEVGRITLRVLMKVDGVDARRQVLEVEAELYARSSRLDADRAHALSLGVFQINRLSSAG